MKIKPYRSSKIIDVFSIYWFDNETYFYGLPRSYGGFIAYKASDVEVVDPDINFRSVYYHNNARSVHHWALIKEKLLD
ncbi:hypothetical protein DY625_19190, partial [Salmonella enterica]|nr:hypothetical protein [Salmonella enterica]